MYKYAGRRADTGGKLVLSKEDMSMHEDFNANRI